MNAIIWMLCLLCSAALIDVYTLEQDNKNLRRQLAASHAAKAPPEAATCAAWWFGAGNVAQAKQRICGEKK